VSPRAAPAHDGNHTGTTGDVDRDNTQVGRQMTPEAPLENDMEAIIPLVVIIALAVLALRYGYDSRPTS